MGGHAVAVGELDVDRPGGCRLVRPLARRRDHVGTREDEAVSGDDEAGALAGPGIGHAGVVEVGDDGHDAGRAGPVDLRRLKPVADEWLRGHDRGAGVTGGRRGRAEDDGLRLARVQPTEKRSNDEDEGAAHGSGDQRDCGG